MIWQENDPNLMHFNEGDAWLPSVRERECEARVRVCVLVLVTKMRNKTPYSLFVHVKGKWAEPSMGCPNGPRTRMRPKRPCASDVYVVRFGYLVLCDSSY